MQLDRARELLVRVELLSEALRQHLVHSNVREESVVLLEQSASVLESLEVAL